MEKFKAYRVFQENNQIHGKIVRESLNDLGAGDVVIRAAYSSINFKDALAATGRGKILKQFPLNAGIDVAGTVVTSESPQIKVGTEVLVTGCGLGESHDGGYAEFARVPADWVIPVPAGLSLKETMILGTAGFTAALCVHRLQVNDQTPDKGPIVVTGASGGVGTLAVNMLASAGYEVVAVSSKVEHYDFLRMLGAQTVCSIEQLNLGSKPLEAGRFGGAIDNVGGDVLGRILPAIRLWGNVASVGLAAGAGFEATVMPFILRGVSILGISSTNCPLPLRKTLWQRMAQDLKPNHLAKILTTTVDLEHMEPVFEAMLSRKTIGRTLVTCS